MKRQRSVRRAAETSKRAAERSKELAEQDDLLLGFDERGPSHGRLGGFFAISIGASLYAWHLAFAFGTHHTIFYYQRY